MKKFRLFSYEPPAKGVKKDSDRAGVRTDFPGFFVMYGRKFWNLSNLNLLVAVYILILSLGIWKLAAYPVAFYCFLALAALTFGIVNTGVAYVVRGYVRGDPVYILSDFRYAVKHNLLQGILLGVIDIVIIVLLVFDLFFWSGMDLNYLTSYTAPSTDEKIESELDESALGADALDGASVNGTASDDAETSVVGEDTTTAEGDELQPVEKEQSFLDGVFFYTCIFLLILYCFMRNYIYILLVTFKLSIFKILKNAFIFAVLGIKRNLAAFFGMLIVCVINVYAFVLLPLVGLTLPLIITTTTLNFIGTYAAYPIIKKYMITPYYDDEEVFEEYDRIFTDRE